MGLKDNMEGKLSEHGDQAKTGVDKAGDMVDKKTQGKYTSTVDKVQDAAKNAVDKSNPKT
jgi:uncharacterized protein YjbJ (UPF0337 family)